MMPVIRERSQKPKFVKRGYRRHPDMNEYGFPCACGKAMLLVKCVNQERPTGIVFVCARCENGPIEVAADVVAACAEVKEKHPQHEISDW